MTQPRPSAQTSLRSVSKFLLFVVVALTQLSPPLQAQDKQDKTTSEHELRKIEKEWDNAIVRRDLAALDRILNDDFKYIDSAGDVHSKSDIIQEVKSSTATIEPFETEGVQTRIYCNTGILTGRFTQRVTYEGKTYSGQFRYTDVYVKQGSSWRAVSAHASRIPDAQQ
jgi:ketosteroid isomerase-like protein